MDNDESIHAFTLKCIIFLDSLCFGLMYPHLAPHLLDIQGTQFSVGIFTALNLILSLMSQDFTSSFETIKGKKFATYLVFMISIMSHLFVTMTSSVTFTIISRLIFTLINEANSYCRALFLKITPASTHEQEIIMISILSSCGYLLGPSIGGYIFALPGGFTILGLIAAGITFGNVLLLLRVPCAKEDYEPQTAYENDMPGKYKRVIEQNVEDFKQSDYNNTWQFMAVQFLFTSGWTMFFLKFTQVLYSNFNSGSITFGHAGAFKNLLLFGSAAYVTEFKTKYLDRMPLVSTLDCSFLVHFIAMCGICYSQTFIAYWILCFPLIFTKTLINSYWSEMYSYSGNTKLVNLITAINVISGIFIPIFFGLICTVLCPNIVKFIAVTSVLSAYIIFTLFVKPKCS